MHELYLSVPKNSDICGTIHLLKSAVTPTTYMNLIHIFCHRNLHILYFAFILSRVTVTKMRVQIGNWIYRILTVVTTNNYNIIADIHNLQSLHTNLSVYLH
jgi:hypothetical protein